MHVHDIKGVCDSYVAWAPPWRLFLESPLLGITTLTAEQQEAISQFALGRDALPTRYKSLSYYMPPNSHWHFEEGQEEVYSDGN